MRKIILGVILIICLVSCATNTSITESPSIEQEEIIVIDKEETTRRLEKERSEIVAFLSERNIDSTRTTKPEKTEDTIEQVPVQTKNEESALENQTFVIEPIETEEKTSTIVNVIDAVVESVKEVSSTHPSETETELKVVNSPSELFLELLNSESFYSALHKIYDGVITRTQENT